MERGHVIGMELNEKICQISYYDKTGQEPQTMEVNADNYPIPLAIGRRGQDWVYGKEAQRLDIVAGGNSVTNLLHYAMHHELVQVGDKMYEGVGCCLCISSLC